MTQRWRGARIVHTGWGNVAYVHDRARDRDVGVYFRLGRWRLYASDDPAPRGAAAVARRALRTVA